MIWCMMYNADYRHLHQREMTKVGSTETEPQSEESCYYWLPSQGFVSWEEEEKCGVLRKGVDRR